MQNMQDRKHARGRGRMRAKEDAACREGAPSTENAAPAEDAPSRQKMPSGTPGRWALRLVFSSAVFLAANTFWIGALWPGGSLFSRLGAAVLFLLANVFPSFDSRAMPSRRLKRCADGCELLTLFLIAAAASAVFAAAVWTRLFLRPVWLTAAHFLTVFLLLALVFWNGMIRIYLSSLQLGVKWRALGALCGWIPGVNLAVLIRLISIVRRETEFESMRIFRNRARKEEKLCATRYPILMVHGVFFRDFKYFNYWGRIPRELEENGARIYYGNHQSAASVADSAKELAERIRAVAEESGCGKVNIIAHSKGGLDCRYAVSLLGMAPWVASLTTINTPHRGCEFADYLLGEIPEAVKERTAAGYNGALRRLGDENPDFMAAVTDLTASSCRRFNSQTPDCPEVFCRSVGSKLNRALGGRFPLNFSHALVSRFDGPNDGLVGEGSFSWGESYRFLTVKGKRGISHGDMIDLNRENIPGFDVREFYVGLVHELKEMGY